MNKLSKNLQGRSLLNAQQRKVLMLNKQCDVDHVLQ